jgi:pimeloyl-ACP methyl ester carboxylesterase
MADDLAAVIDQLGVGPVIVVAHDWGGPVSFIMMLRHPQKVAGYFGVNTLAPRLRRDRAMVAHLWRFWYQLPIALPIAGPRLIADREARFFRLLVSWVAARVGTAHFSCVPRALHADRGTCRAGGGFSIPEHDLLLFVDSMRESGHAVAPLGSPPDG